MFVTSLHETRLNLKHIFVLKITYIHILYQLFINSIQENEFHEDGNFACVHCTIHSHLKQCLSIVGSQEISTQWMDKWINWKDKGRPTMPQKRDHYLQESIIWIPTYLFF